MKSALTLALAAAVAVSPIAHAGPADGARGATPWSKGVSEAAQRRALALFQDGNVYFEQAKYTDAVSRYEQALAAWDHPNIRFNMAVCLINMRQPLVAWDHLQRALRFGDAPLGKRLYAEAQTYVAVLEASLGELRVRTHQPEVKVTVDGQTILTGDGKRTLKLLAGKHQLVASGPGLATDTRALDLTAGKAVELDLELGAPEVKVERENYERRWGWWAPWAVAGSGLVLGAVGAAVYVSARADIRSYDQDLAALCPAGCKPSDIPAELSGRATTARRKSGIGIGVMAGGGAFVIASGVMAILNRPRKVEERRPTPELSVAPGYVGVGLRLAWD